MSEGCPSQKNIVIHAYAAGKPAVTGFTKPIAAYYAKTNIRINAMAPAPAETPMAQRAAKNEAILSFNQNKATSGWRTNRPVQRYKRGWPVILCSVTQNLPPGRWYLLTDDGR